MAMKKYQSAARNNRMVASYRQKHSGMVLVMALIFLLVLTILGVTAMRMSGLENIMAGNVQEITRAFEAAESGLTFTNDKKLLNEALTNASGVSVDFHSASDASGWATVRVTFVPPLKGCTRGSGNQIVEGTIQCANFSHDSEGKTKAGAKAFHSLGSQITLPPDNST